ncbi:MAG TPA: tryptophan--tRNA ligase [Methylomirabilota bacterium]|jgi:tryptophanyl-tRNA synthetase|nr:tryptophan--tRNA ligase [Methylomirabilota bacterium]
MTGSDTGAGPGRPRVFSGIQPSGDVHLGNYLGAIKRWVRDQDRTESFFCLVDLHALTAPQDPEALRARTRSLCALLLAAGLVPSRSTLFVQSHVPAHAEACWLLNCVTPLGWLHRMTQYKDRAARHESVTTGLLDYPVLMAADILLYRADEVPVGEDQRQHVELARDIAARFNRLYGETLRVPTAVVPEAGARVMGLDDPLVKMSKSLAGRRGHAIRVLDGADEIRRKVMGAVTDPGREIAFSDDPARAGVQNLLGIYQAIRGLSREGVLGELGDVAGYGELKRRVADAVIAELQPIREAHDGLLGDAAELDRLLARGADRARAVAEPTLRAMQHRMGLVVPSGAARRANGIARPAASARRGSGVDAAGERRAAEE